MKKKKIISIALIVLFAACAAFTGMTAYWQWDDQRRSAEDFDALAQLVADTPQAPEQTPAPGTELPEEPKTKRRRPMPSTPSCMRSTMILSAGSP